MLKEEASSIISKMSKSVKSDSELNNLRNQLNKDIKNISLYSIYEQENISKNLIDINDIKPNTEVFVTNFWTKWYYIV